MPLYKSCILLSHPQRVNTWYPPHFFRATMVQLCWNYNYWSALTGLRTLTFKIKEVRNPVGEHSTLAASHTVSQKLFWILAKGFSSFWPTCTNPYTRVCATKGSWINAYGNIGKQITANKLIMRGKLVRYQVRMVPVHEIQFLTVHFWQTCSPHSYFSTRFNHRPSAELLFIQPVYYNRVTITP